MGIQNKLGHLIAFCILGWNLGHGVAVVEECLSDPAVVFSLWGSWEILHY